MHLVMPELTFHIFVQGIVLSKTGEKKIKKKIKPLQVGWNLILMPSFNGRKVKYK